MDPDTKNDSPNKPLSYREAGVDIAAGNALVDRIRPLVARTSRPGVLSGLGGFGGLFEIPPGRYREPVLVSGTDGVGTKLKLALQLGRHDTVGIDLVAMCVNDILVCGAEPLFFLDYYATGHLDVDVATAVVEGIVRGCEMAGTALIGGETAEMPGMYSHGDYDLAGFSVGVVEKSEIITPQRVCPGDVLLGVASSGPHSNGYSLIRKLVQVSSADLSLQLREGTLGELLLAPTRIYVKSVLKMLSRIPVHALAHITGGGLLENVPRVLPAHTTAVIDEAAWSRPEVFDWIQDAGSLADEEMWRTFNCGIGMVVCVPVECARDARSLLEDEGEKVWQIGSIEPSAEESPTVDMKPARNPGSA